MKKITRYKIKFYGSESMAKQTGKIENILVREDNPKEIMYL